MKKTLRRQQHARDPSLSHFSSKEVANLVTAIGRGEIDALVLPTPQGQRVFTCCSDEQPYRVLIEAMSEGALTISRHGTVLYCNSAFARIVGKQLERVIGSFLLDVVHSADHAKLEALLADGCREFTRAEISLLSGSSHPVPVYVSAHPLPSESGDRICAVVTDLTEIDAARQAQFQLAAIVEASCDAILSTTSQGVVLSWNRGAERMFGYTAAEMIGRSILSFIPEDRCEEFLYLLERVRAGEAAENFEMVQPRKDGLRLDLILSLSPIRDRQGKVIAASAIARDNTARKRVQRRIQSVLESAPDAIVVVNQNGDIVLVNTQAELMFGYRRDEMITQPLTLLMPTRFHATFGAWRLQEHHLRMPGNRHEVTAVRAGGYEFPAEISVGRVEADEGMLLCGTVRDVSERHAFQQALREKNAQLQKALQAKDRFLATMSHELRTPIHAIVGFTGILLMKIPGELNAAQTRQLELVRSSARHLLAIVSDLLDLARIESGNAKLQIEDVSCIEVLEDTMRELSNIADQKQIAVHVERSPDPVTIRTDRRFLLQILSNLVGNAVKFTDRGSIRLAYTTNATLPCRTVCFVIEDTGIGIQPEDLSRLFTEFCRVQSASADHREGTGLGLHLSQRLAALLGGRITVESVFGKGSIFVLTLPQSPAGD